MDEKDTIALYSIENERENLEWLIILFAIINVLLIIATVLLNTVALATLIKQRTLHNPSNTIIGALCIANIVSASIEQTIYEYMLVCLLKNTSGCINKTLVTIFHVSFTACKGSLCFITAMVSIDRYFAICYPFKYLGQATITKYVIIIALFTGFWFIYSLCLILIFPLETFYGSIIVIIFCSFVALDLCYTRVLIIVHKQQVRVQTIGEIAGSVALPQVKEKSKACFILVEILIFNIFNLPMLIFAFHYLIHGFDGSYKTPFVLINLGYTMSNLICFLNALVYCFRSSEMRKATKKLISQTIPDLRGRSATRKTMVAPLNM